MAHQQLNPGIQRGGGVSCGDGGGDGDGGDDEGDAEDGDAADKAASRG